MHSHSASIYACIQATKKLIAHLLQGSVMVLLRQKVYVSGGDDADKFAAHLASLCDRDPREAVADLCLKDVADCVPGAHHHWVCYETLLKFLARTITQMFSKALSVYGLKPIVICTVYIICGSSFLTWSVSP